MDVLLITNGVVENIAVFETLDQAQQLYPGYTVVERCPANAHLNPGDTNDQPG